MKSTHKKITLFYCASVLAIFSSCNREKRNDDKPDANDVVAAQEMAIADQLFGELKNIADQGESGSLDSYKNGQPAFADCATVTVEKPQKKITIDFGSTNCICRDFRLRRGVLEVTYTGSNYWDSGSVATIIPTNYYVNDYRLEGSKIISNASHLSDPQPYWRVGVDGVITKPNGGGSFQWKSERIHIWMKGNTTPFTWTDDEWEVSGIAKLTTSTAVEWNLFIDLPLHRALSCRYIDEGIIRISRIGLTDRFVNYGTRTCDDDAVYTANGVNYPFKLK